SPVADSIRNVAFEIYQGNCNSLSSLLQVNNNASPFDADTTKGEIQSVENLTIGNTYYIRVYSSGVFRPITVDVAGSFNICVSLSANDVCSKAIEVPVNAGPDCITVTLDSLDNATVTPGTSYCNIVNSNLIKDVWFKFTALDTLQLITVNQRGFQLFSGDCGNLTSILCGGPREIIGSLLCWQHLLCKSIYRH
ncbi:MAG: hypothetical protein IPP72_15330, partial [Chitinophagaceae bacterium]|nr:hypothetical protein [Chitinophagaceae bacterium]